MKYLSIFFLSLFWMGCGENPFYFSSVDIKEGTWYYLDTLPYQVDIVDTTRQYDLALEIEHTQEYEYQNLYLKILTFFPDGQSLDQTLPIDFADHTGLWYGDCRGDECTLEVLLQERARFNQIGEHKFYIVQYMRSEPVQGIKRIALSINQKI